jgi:ABC-2 type transport system permease protein
VLPWIPAVLVLMALLACTVLGVGLILSVTNVYFRDVKHFMSIALQALFYSAPIVYPVTLVPEESTILGVTVPVRFLYELNPLVRFVESFRDVLYNLRLPSLTTTVYLVGWAIGSLVVGLQIFGRLEPRLAEEV